MIIIFGLGNPGRKFYKTRHNVGFQVVDKFKIENEFSNWRGRKKDFKALISEGKINNKKIILAKPQTFMNSSGQSVKLLIENCKLTPKSPRSARTTGQEIKNLFVVHDDLDIPLGKIRIVKNRGSAGHKGIQSIIDELGTQDFIRFRIGIDHGTWNMEPRTRTSSVRGKHGTKREDFVLEKFTKEEQKIIKEIKKRACEALELTIKEGVEKAMSEYNC